MHIHCHILRNSFISSYETSTTLILHLRNLVKDYPVHVSKQSNVIGLYLPQIIATDFFFKIKSASTSENSGDSP